MATKIFDNNGIVSFDSISSEKDLKLRPRININPPPTDGRCECCGRHISEIEPFDTSRDTISGNFEGALLIKIFRPMEHYDEEAETAWDNSEKQLADAGIKDEHPLERVFIKYRNEKGQTFYFSGPAPFLIVSSWECRDCVGLDTGDYFDKIRSTREMMTLDKKI